MRRTHSQFIMTKIQTIYRSRFRSKSKSKTQSKSKSRPIYINLVRT